MNNNPIAIPAHPIPNMMVQLQLDLDHYIEMLQAHPQYILLRSTLLANIDARIVHEYANENHEALILLNNLADAANGVLFNNQARWIFNSIMDIVINAPRDQKIHIFNRIVGLQRP